MKSQELAQGCPFEVQNQPTPFEDFNLYDSDSVLVGFARQLLNKQQQAELSGYGERLGRADMMRAGRAANDNVPQLHCFDRYGHRIDEVEYHPTYHQLMDITLAAGVHSEPWESDTPGRYVSRAAKMYLKHQVEQGTSCPATMTFAAVPSLKLQPDVAECWLPGMMSRTYDPRHLAPSHKQGLLFGMAMTERQGGSDVQSNATRAKPDGSGGPGRDYRITGHKWFCSAPMSDAFLTLAQAPGGLSCFIVPRLLPDGTRNALYFQRLKDKLGNRSNASSEVEFRGAHAVLLNEEGRGVATIIEMVRHTRLDCVIGAAGLIRRCTAEALHHTCQRYAFSKPLIDQPLMKNVLADMCIESEAATVSALELSALYEGATTDPDTAPIARLATAIIKYWSTKRETVVAREALECTGGNGYIEESPMPQLFRESPLNSIWEGSGNVQCLDVLRTVQRNPQSLERFADYARHHLPSGDPALAVLDDALITLNRAASSLEGAARSLVQRLALVFQAAALNKYAAYTTAEAFSTTRLANVHPGILGSLPSTLPLDELIERNMPRS